MNEDERLAAVIKELKALTDSFVLCIRVSDENNDDYIQCFGYGAITDRIGLATISLKRLQDTVRVMPNEAEGDSE